MAAIAENRPLGKGQKYIYLQQYQCIGSIRIIAIVFSNRGLCKINAKTNANKINVRKAYGI